MVYFNKYKDIGDDDISDLLADYKVTQTLLHAGIDPSLRSHLSKRGVSIMQNIYTGFDTEYKNIDIKWNKLLSVQLAVNTRTALKLPLIEDYKLSSLEASTGERYAIKLGSYLNSSLILDYINKSIKYIRDLKFGIYDNSIKKLIDGLKIDTPFVEKDDSVYFLFERTGIKQ